jgi:hypothetical protein
MFWNTPFMASPPLFMGTTIVGTLTGVAAHFLAPAAIQEIHHLRQLSEPAAKAHDETPPRERGL